MKQNLFKKEHTTTPFLMLNTKKCKACWKCLNACPNKVIGRINLPWHKHIRFINRNACVGCMKCLNLCSSTAITKSK